LPPSHPEEVRRAPTLVLSRRALLLVLAFASRADRAPRAVAQTGNASLEVHQAVCPAGYDGDNFFEDCHGSGAAGYVFALDGPDGRREATTVVENDPGPGVVRFEDPAGGTYALSETPPPGVSATPFRVFCFRAETDEPIPATPEGDGVSLEVTAGDTLICDWFDLPPAPIVGPPAGKGACKRGGWRRFDTPRRFKNQGDCIRFVQTGK
jgi:hypothetical protein